MKKSESEMQESGTESEMKECEIPKRGLLQLQEGEQEGERGNEGSKVEVEGSEIGAQRARKREEEKEKEEKKMDLLAKKKNNELQQKGERVLQETETSHVICQVLRACLRGHTGVSVQFL